MRPGVVEEALLLERLFLPMQLVAKTRGRYWAAGGPCVHGRCPEGHWLRLCL